MNSFLLYNANIFTGHSEQGYNPHFDAIYVENGIIKVLGTSSDLKLQLPSTKVKWIDLHGAFVLPGLVDSHLHLPGHGMRLSSLDLSKAKSKEEMLQIVRKHVHNTPSGKWVIGLQWNENQFLDVEVPTIEELDQISREHPILLSRVCTHVHLANSLAFTMAGLTASSSNPTGGSFGRDIHGKFNGLIYENASKPFYDNLPQSTYSEKKEYVRKAMVHALSLGLTAAHTEDLRYLGDVDMLLRIYRELHEEGIYFRTNHLIYHPHLEQIKERGLTTGSGDAWFTIGAVKIFSDGSLGGRTALLSTPYEDASNTFGMAIHTQEQLNEITQQARFQKMAIAVHAIGDGAADRTITAMETHPVQQVTPYRDRLIHAQIMRKDLNDRLTRLQVAVDIQPQFVTSDFPWIFDRVGKNTSKKLYAWKTLINTGLMCAGGSDAPIESINPLEGIHAAITRRKVGEDHSGYIEEEKLSFRQAIHLYTMGSAQAATEDQERGSIEVGKFADFTVFENDLFALEDEPDSIVNAKVLMTFVNGKIAYSV